MLSCHLHYCNLPGTTVSFHKHSFHPTLASCIVLWTFQLLQILPMQSPSKPLQGELKNTKSSNDWHTLFVCIANTGNHLFTREFRKSWRQGQYQLKMILYFASESCSTLKSFTLLITVKAAMKLNLRHIDKFSEQCRVWSFLVFLQRKDKNVPRIIRHLHSYCSH